MRQSGHLCRGKGQRKARRKVVLGVPSTLQTCHSRIFNCRLLVQEVQIRGLRNPQSHSLAGTCIRELAEEVAEREE